MLQRSCWLTTTRGFPSTGPGLWAPGLNKKIQTYFLIHREEKSLRHIAMVAKVLDDNKTEKVTYSKEPKSVNAFIIILFTSCRFSPIRSQLETVLDFWLVNVCMKECELIKGDHTFRLLGKSLFALFQTSPTSFNFIQFGKSWQNFLLDRIYGHLSLEKEIDNFFCCVHPLHKAGSWN